MEISGAAGKSPNTSLSFRYNANNEELEELFHVCGDDEPPSPPFDSSPTVKSETESPKKSDRTPSIIDKYFKSMRTEKSEKSDDKSLDASIKTSEDIAIHSAPKDVQSSPMKEYLKNLGKRNNSEPVDVKEGPNETWKIFHDFKFKIAQAVEDMKTRSAEDKEKSVPRDNSVSDSEENSVIKDSDQSIGDTDNQVSSLDSSILNLSEMSQPVTAKGTEHEDSPVFDTNNTDSSDDTHKNLDHSETGEAVKDRTSPDPQLEIESGVEALEDGIDGFSELSPTSNEVRRSEAPEAAVPNPPSLVKTASQQPPSKTNLKSPKEPEIEPKNYFFNFTMYFVTFLLVINYILFREWHILHGFLLGVWSFCFASNLKQWVLDTYVYESEHRRATMFTMKRSDSIPFTYTIPPVREHTPLKKYEGWINHYRYPEYDPCTYHLNDTTTAFMKIEGYTLRISYTKTKVSRRAFWSEKLDKVEFYQHRLYNLTGARVILLPRGLVKRRLWSKKYPICIILSKNEKIRVLENKSAEAERRASEAASTTFEIDKETAETNTTPEKKRKFVWRRKEKSMIDNDSGRESIKDQHVSKEGLRHRLVRRMHRDKKTDSVSTSTDIEIHSQISQADKTMRSAQLEEVVFHDAEEEPSVAAISGAKDEAFEEEIDESEIARIKEFLDETELETGALSTSAEGEWSIHVKQYIDKPARLFIFARSSRDKHEWYRRLNKVIAQVNASLTTEPSEEDSQPNGESPENKDGVEMTSFSIDKEVSYTKSSNPKDSTKDTEKVTLSTPGPLATDDIDKVFWPYLIKIIQSTKAPDPCCDCRMLPLEVTWLNTVIARVAYDVMRNQETILRMQTKIQKKINTVKLPPFMSPLVVNELSLSGACPLVERVSVPSWDERGIWIDMDLRYDGGGYIAISTQINLMKLKEKSLTVEEQLAHQETDEGGRIPYLPLYPVKILQQLRLSKAAIYDSDLEDSAESSSDEESPPTLQRVDSMEELKTAEPMPRISTSADPAAASSSKKKFLRIVDRIATNKYFQQVTDYKYIKRAMEGLSNTDIKLQLEVQRLEGRLVLNFPPPPHDRVWVGFRTNPQLELKARPAVGARTLKFAHISNWIEQKLTKEFEKVLVMPNMEDFIFDLMNPTPVEFE